MDTRNSTNLSAKKVMGLIGLIVCGLVFVFSCLKSVLPVGRVLFATFGILVYPLSIIFGFINLAIFLGFTYTKRLKPTAFMLITLTSILFVIHSIDTFSALDKVASTKTLGEYIKLPYITNKATLLGSVGSIVTGLLSRVLGGMGTIVLFVIIATIFGGLFIDYQFYGKYQEEHITKIKTRKMRQKVYTSDADRTADSQPNYTFNSEVVDEISVDASEYESGILEEECGKPFYSDDDVMHEITDDQISSFGDENTYSGNFYQDEPQTQNTFSNDVYKGETYPNIYSSESSNYQSGRDFISATFGGKVPEPSKSDMFGDPVTSQAETSFNFGSFETENEEKPNWTSGLDLDNENYVEDEVSKILNSTEKDEDEVDFKPNIFDETPQTTGFGMTFSDPILPQQPVVESAPAVESTPYVKPDISRNDGFGSILRQPEQPMPRPSYRPELEPTGFGMQQVSPMANVGLRQNNVVVPAKEPKISPVHDVNIGMKGVRYNPPPLSLLVTPKKDTVDHTAEQIRKTTQLESVLESFNINAKVVNIVRGPKITRYELALPKGTTVKKIPQYEDDIAAALSAKTITIRAPIPGSPYVGIELENDVFTTVYQRELFESDAFQNFKDPLPIAIGKDISGEIVVKGLADMTHLLIAGSTGSGKSVFIHNIVLSILYKHSPEDVKLIMIDPKRVEFPQYNGLPHLITPEVVTGAHKAIGALKWCVKEMDRRYELMSKAGFNNIKTYNKSDLVKAGQFDKFPYIVIIVDELAEIMQANKKEAEGYIQRITQLARACGMHMVVATQRPSVDIITGVIKNNIPSRVAFSLQTGIDSKTILGTVGAEKLLGKGDMIFAPTGTSATPRLQGSYATDDEIKKIIEYVKHNNIAKYDEAIATAIEAEQSTEDGGSTSFSGGEGVPLPKNELDSYFQTAVKICMQNGGASVSYLQRRLGIGYSRGAKIIDQMEQKGYIGRATGSKPRPMIITPEQFREEFGVDYDSID